MKTTTVQALRAVYVALGGAGTDIPDNMEIPEAITKIAEKIAVSGGQLPAVTTSDNGKVLKVASGKWAIGTDEIQA